ncbi:hypothetical protein M8J77_023972 [Diaphorina citri]|nr:hypothetical protein M8J77_023972 [Diaphorina citri]
MAKEPVTLGTIKKPNGEWTQTGKETLETLIETHFPGSESFDYANPSDTARPGTPLRKPQKDDWELAKNVVTHKKLEWAISTFQPFKAAGNDGIFPALLQRAKEIVIPILCRLFKASIATGYIPINWRGGRVVFIPKPGKKDYAEAKSYRPITLLSSVLKTLEKLVDKYVRKATLSRTPLHRNQHAYQAGKSCESALHHLVARLENTLEHKEAALAAFLDIEGAFDNTPFNIINRATQSRGIESTLCRWIAATLRDRHINITNFGVTVQATVKRGCPQGGVLSPLLWNLVVDSLLETLNSRGYYAQGYADDVVIVIRGKHLNTISELMRSALLEVEHWCGEVDLNFNPNKTSLILFTNKRNMEGLVAPTLFGKRLSFSNEVKYLGVNLDPKLTWNKHLESIKLKCTRSLMMARRTFGKSWGLKPRVMSYLYREVIRPTVTYCAVVWWPKTDQRQAKELLDKIQRLGCLCITSCTPTLAMETLLGLTPLDIHVKGTARTVAHRLKLNNTWITQHHGHSIITTAISDPLFEMRSDMMAVEENFDNPVNVVIETAGNWGVKETQLLKKGAVVWYTDGSKTEAGSGAGIHCVKPRVNISLPLGTYTGVYQAEVLAIRNCAEENINMGLS